jgi:hypothetical protein
MKKSKWLAPTLGLILALASSSVTAGECGYEKCWGAIGFGPSGKITYAFGKWSERAAFRAANKSCKGQCSEIRTFFNECAAVAQGSDQKWSLSKGPTRDLAQTRATRACSSNSTDCQVIVWACSR